MEMRESGFQFDLDSSRLLSFTLQAFVLSSFLFWLVAYQKLSKKCGMKFHDDYIELQTDAVLRLEQLLEEYFSSTSEPADVAGPGAISDASVQGRINSRWEALRSKLRFFKNKASILPHHQNSEQSEENLRACPAMLGTSCKDHKLALLCIPFVRLASKLWQAEICRINSDQDFFRVLRHYYNNRGKKPWAWLRKVQAVHFVKVSAKVFVPETAFCVLLWHARRTVRHLGLHDLISRAV